MGRDNEKPPEPMLWQAIKVVEALGLPMVKRLFWYPGTTIETLFRLSQRPAGDHIRAVSIMEIVERQGHGGLSNRDPLDDALGRLDRIQVLERERASKGGQ